MQEIDQLNSSSEFGKLPGRHLVDTNVINMLWSEGAAIFDEQIEHIDDERRREDVLALNQIMKVNQRASFQLVISPLSFAEIANTQNATHRHVLLQWFLELTDHWLITLDEIGDRLAAGGTVRHRFKLTDDLQNLEARLFEIPDFRRDPLDRLLLLQSKMANCDAFLTLDENTIWNNRSILATLDIEVLRPRDFWKKLKPWAGLWY